MAAPVPRAAVFDLEASQRIELPTDNGLLRPALTQSLEFHKVRIGRALAKPRALTRVAQISLRLQLRARRGKASVERDILRDVSGACFPGMLMAIMGATGSGKTSLMNVLARRLVLSKGLHVSGAVLLNGAPRPRQWKSNYVEQHDLLFAELSVRETLQFAARLRLPTTATPAERDARVDAVVATLGLQAVLDSRVGGDLVRGISGGERKRLALGNDLIVDPPLLFLDEPTSGLDAFNAQSVMSSLKLLASTGRSVVACLHQPRSGITALFDSLLLLSEGRCMYSGPAPEALQFFERCGFVSPPVRKRYGYRGGLALC
jgi:ABC-type multidrug transport system ATPase subunit